MNQIYIKSTGVVLFSRGRCDLRLYSQTAVKTFARWVSAHQDACSCVYENCILTSLGWQLKHPCLCLTVRHQASQSMNRPLRRLRSTDELRSNSFTANKKNSLLINVSTFQKSIVLCIVAPWDPTDSSSKLQLQAKTLVSFFEMHKPAITSSFSVICL